MVLAFLLVVFLVQRLLCKAAQRMRDSGRQYSVAHCMRHEKGLAKELLTGQEDSRFHSAEDGNKNQSPWLTDACSFKYSLYSGHCVIMFSNDL